MDEGFSIEDILNSPDEFILILEFPGRSGSSYKGVDLKRGLATVGQQGADCFLRLMKMIFDGKKNPTPWNLNNAYVDAWLGNVIEMKNKGIPIAAFRLAYKSFSKIVMP